MNPKRARISRPVPQMKYSESPKPEAIQQIMYKLVRSSPAQGVYDCDFLSIDLSAAAFDIDQMSYIVRVTP